jgi:hypothetical protein
MASELEHITLANRNHDMLIHLLGHLDKYPEWVTTVAFYKAVHVVEALFANDLRQHSMSHTDREKRLKHPKFQAIFKNYKPLLDASRIARYLSGPKSGGYCRFSDYLDADGVANKLVKKRLYGVEQNALRYLGEDAKSTLKKIEPVAIDDLLKSAGE